MTSSGVGEGPTMELPTGLSARPFTQRQALAHDVPKRALRAMVEEGLVVRVLRGVYRSSTLDDTLEVRCQAAAMVMRPFGVLCDRTAAWLHGVDTFRAREFEAVPPIDTLVLRGHSRTRRPECRGGRRDLTPCDVIRIHGVLVTTPLRTALDLACALGARDALASLDGFMRTHGITHEEMTEQLPRYRRRRGVVQLRRLIPLATSLSESPGESWTRMAIVEAGLAAPEPQVWVCDAEGRPRYRLDLAYAWAKVAIEYDGREFHTLKNARRNDERRRAWLRKHGWTVIVVTRDSFTFEAWMAWTMELSEALHAAKR